MKTAVAAEKSEKKEIPVGDFSIPMSEKIEEEVKGMCNLSQGIWDRGRKTGHAEGIAEGVAISKRAIALAMFQNDEPIEKIKLYTGFSDAEIATLVKAQPAQ